MGMAPSDRARAGISFFKSRFEKKADRNSIVKSELKVLTGNTTALHNELVTVFTPYLHPGNLSTKERRDQHRKAVEQFASRRDYRDKIDKACTAVDAAGKECQSRFVCRLKNPGGGAQAFPADR